MARVIASPLTALAVALTVALTAGDALAQSGSKPGYGSGVVPAARPLAVGDRATAFTVIDQRGRSGPVTALGQRGKQTVLVFSRGSFCPFCMAHLTELQNSYEEIKAAGAELIVIFREEPQGTNGILAARRNTRASFPIVLDPQGRGSGRAYSVDGYAAYVIDESGIITAILAATKKERPSLADILAALQN